MFQHMYTLQYKLLCNGAFYIKDHLKPKAVCETPLQQLAIELLAEEGLPRAIAASVQDSKEAISLRFY